MLGNIFSVTNSLDKTHKVIRLCGIKVNIRKKKKMPNKDVVLENSPYHKFDFNGIKNIQKNKYCSGCTACKSICPNNAISMKENIDGFMTPYIDGDKCIHCGMCDNVCPIINFKYEKAPKKSICYAAAGHDDLREKSSSGGIFSLIAEVILKKGGYVCGAKFSEDFYDVKHVIISKIDDLNYLRFSKYVQSDLNDVFIQIKELLEKNKVVLFSGTPCQVAGLKAYLKKDYETLFLLDLSCGGTPSKKVYRKFLNECIKNTNDEKITSVKFRMKDKGWYSYATEYKTTKYSYRISNGKSIFQQAFLKGLSINRVCQVCPYDTLKREGDITLGDFWGIDKFNKKCDDKKGTSLLIVNTKKGAELVKSIKKELKFIKKASIKWAIVDNYNLIKPICHHNRAQFFFNLDKLSLNDNYSQCIRDTADCIVFNHAITSYNYGSVLTAYAIQEVLCNMGYFTKILNTQRVPFPDYIGSFGQKFARDYLHLTEPCQTEKEFIDLNNKSNIFLVGSDQVWRSKYWKNDLDRVLLNFVESNKKKIGIAVSFGTEEFEGTEDEKGQYRKALPTFNAITTRECSGVDICKSEFACEATWILDPVFIHYEQDYIRMTDLSKFDCTNKLVYYGWNFERDKLVLEKIAENRNCNGVINITGQQLSVEDWLNAIKTSKYFVSNSFHGICFAIIFNKNFICINDIGEGRFNSLSKLFNLDKIIVKNILDVDETILKNVPDYLYINNCIKKERNKAINLIKSILE